MSKTPKVLKRDYRWSRYGLRTVFVVLTIGCMCLAWMARNIHQAEEQREAIEAIRKMGGEVWYDYQREEESWVSPGDPPFPAWLLNLLGIDFFAKVKWVAFWDVGVSDLDLTWLAKQKLERLDLDERSVNDVTPLANTMGLEQLTLKSASVNDVTPLAKLTTLRGLNLRSTQVSDVTPLAELKNLRRLDLAGTHVTDVSPLAGLTNLQELDLSYTPVSDVTPLAGLKNLTHLRLGPTQVNAKQVEKLKQALPNCTIER